MLPHDWFVCESLTSWRLLRHADVAVEHRPTTHCQRRSERQTQRRPEHEGYSAGFPREAPNYLFDPRSRGEEVVGKSMEVRCWCPSPRRPWVLTDKKNKGNPCFIQRQDIVGQAQGQLWLPRCPVLSFKLVLNSKIELCKSRVARIDSGIKQTL